MISLSPFLNYLRQFDPQHDSYNHFMHMFVQELLPVIISKNTDDTRLLISNLSEVLKHHGFSHGDYRKLCLLAHHISPPPPPPPPPPHQNLEKTIKKDLLNF